MKFKTILLSFSICFCACYANAQSLFTPETSERSLLNLNGKWKYILDPYETDNIGFMPLFLDIKPKDKSDRVEYSFDDAQTLYVPGSWNSQKPELYYYEGSIWYRKIFNINKVDKSKRYFVRIGAANYICKIALNGNMAGFHEGGFTPIYSEITNLIKDGDNSLIIGVNDSRKDDNIPGKVTDWFNHGGITRDVTLMEVPQDFIENYLIALNKKSLNEKNKVIEGKVIINGNCNNVKVEIKELNSVAKCTKNSKGEYEFRITVKNLQLWNPENPKLYKVEITADEDKISDEVGFRVIETQGNKILLNGKPIFLKGISMHDENPQRADRANSVSDAEYMLNSAKELGCNFIRLAHYPHQDNILKLADKKGILLWEELPLYWGINWKSDEVFQKAKNQYTELINRDYNRASSIIWSIANETSPEESRNAFLGNLADYIRTIDSTRLISAACKKDQPGDGNPAGEYTINDPIIQKLDIIAFNEYLGWYGGLPEECRTKTFSTESQKPIIVSETGGGALAGFHGDSLTRWSEEYQEYLYKEAIPMFDKIDGLSGITPWILFDFMSPLRQLPGVQDGWNRKGLISEKGEKKKAFFVLKEYYSKK